LVYISCLWIYLDCAYGRSISDQTFITETRVTRTQETSVTSTNTETLKSLFLFLYFHLFPKLCVLLHCIKEFFSSNVRIDSKWSCEIFYFFRHRRSINLCCVAAIAYSQNLIILENKTVQRDMFAQIVGPNLAMVANAVQSRRSLSSAVIAAEVPI
jgi:hypothetical protein